MNTIDMILFNNTDYRNLSRMSKSNIIKKQPEEELIQDTAEISPKAILLSKTDFDVTNSNVEIVGSRINFNLEFQSSELERLSTKGYYSEERNELNLSLDFIFQKGEVIGGQTRTRIFEANLSLSVSEVNTFSVSPFERKEDIIDLVRRLVNRISEISQDDTKKLGGVIFDPEDFRDIATIDDGKLAEILYSLIQMVMLYTNIVREVKEGQKTDTVFLHPERIRTSGIEIQKTFNAIRNFNLEIKDITDLKELVVDD